jgi:transcriptional regulator with XRE-family HTH domain
MSTKLDGYCYNLAKSHLQNKGEFMKHIFSSRLVRLRTKAGLSQKQFAGILNIAPGSMSNYENGLYLPPLEKTISMAQKLHASMDYLTGLTDINFPPELLTKPITENITFGHLIKLLYSLEKKDLEEIMRYADYLKYKRKRSNYAKEPKAYLVAEDNNTFEV